MNCGGANQKPADGRKFPFRPVALPLVLAVLAATGCNTVKQTANLPVDAVNAVIPGNGSKQVEPAALQNEVLRYADAFASQSSAGMNDYADRVGTQNAQIQVLNWKLSMGSTVLGIATAPNPSANLLDMVSLATLTRMSVEQQASNAVPPGAFDSWLDKSRNLETNAWRLAAGVFATNQLAQLRTSIELWSQQNPSDSSNYYASPQILSSLIAQAKVKSNPATGIFNIVNLDPLGGLDPAVREVTRSRLFAERAMFVLQRMPQLTRWQIQLLSDQLLNQNQVTEALQTGERISHAAESLSQTAALLPGQIADERKAILDSLQSQEGQLKGLSEQVGQTLSSGQKMSDSLNTTLTTFTTLMKLFGVGEPSTNAPDTNSPPFNILDYAHTADQIAAASAQLDALIKDANSTVDSPALDKRIAQLNTLAEQTQDGAKSILNHAFMLGAGLIVLAFACALVYRRLGRNPPRN